MQKGTKVELVQINPSWSKVPIRIATSQKVGCKPLKVGATGSVLGVQQGTGLILVKFKGRSWPALCRPEDIKQS